MTLPFPLLYCLSGQQSFTSAPRPSTLVATGDGHASDTDPRQVAVLGAVGDTSGAAVGGGVAGVGDEAENGVLNPEEAQQAFLSRLLLMLGSFVIICLVLF